MKKLLAVVLGVFLILGVCAGAFAAGSLKGQIKNAGESGDIGSAGADDAPDGKLTVGAYVTFGHYPQTSEGNDRTPIEWRVLARDGDKALLVSRHALDSKQYNAEYTDVTWDKCTLRSWLNNEFLNKAFSEAEQAAIETTAVDNSRSQGNPRWEINEGAVTQDKVFLLSYKEADKYFANDEARKCAPTDYAVKNDAFTNGDFQADGQPTCWWWMRSPGMSASGAACVDFDGGLGGGSGVNSIGNSVRPALWVNSASGIF